MTRVMPEQVLVAALVAGAVVTTILAGSAVWYVNAFLIPLFLAVWMYTRTWPDRGFYLLCSGVPLAVSCGLLSLWAGLYTVCAVAGVATAACGLLESAEERKHFGIFCGISLAAGLLVFFSNHVLLPLVILGIAGSAVILIQSVRRYQIQKQYTGVKQ